MPVHVGASSITSVNTHIFTRHQPSNTHIVCLFFISNLSRYDCSPLCARARWYQAWATAFSIAPFKQPVSSLCPTEPWWWWLAGGETCCWWNTVAFLVIWQMGEKNKFKKKSLFPTEGRRRRLHKHWICTLSSFGTHFNSIASEAADNVAVCKWIFAHFFIYYLCFRCST